MRDAIIPNVTEHDFEQVLKPKIDGAWNLHMLSIETGLTIDNFVLLSSIRYVFAEKQIRGKSDSSIAFR